jgi:glutathione S-transferase
VKLYWAPHTRAMRALWMLEETGCAYERVLVDITTGAQSHPDFLKINPMGKVPALVDGDATVAESGAICAWLADRFPEAGLAPPIGDPARGRYLQWLFFSAGCAEPAYTERMNGWTTDSSAAAWGNFDRVIAVQEEALSTGPWILGERFSAADVLLGIDLHYCMNVIKVIPEKPVLQAYAARCFERPALQRAIAIDAAGV